MNYIIKLSVIFILIPIIMKAQEENVPASGTKSDCMGLIKIETDLENSVIYLNEKDIGRGNARLEVTNGKYIINAKEGSEKWNQKVYTDTVVIENCENKNLVYNFNSEIYLVTEPQDAYVFNNDSLIGHTPLFLSSGLSGVRLSKPGYETKDLSLINLASGNPVKLAYIGEENSESFFRGDLFKILIGGIVVFGATTAYYKLKADDTFEDYLFTGNQYALEQTKKYDTTSGIAFTALQINLGLLIYFFLIE